MSARYWERRCCSDELGDVGNTSLYVVRVAEIVGTKVAHEGGLPELDISEAIVVGVDIVPGTTTA